MSETHKNRPANTLFKQQRLPAWQPILSPPHVTACFAVIAAMFIPIGIAIMNANSRVVDMEFQYDQINKCTYENNQKLAAFPRSLTNMSDVEWQGCATKLQFEIKDKMEAPIYMYYKLTNFYQNHRRFAKSRSESQLAGQDVDASSMDDCEPILHAGSTVSSGDTKLTVNGKENTYGGMKYVPCGLIAWSQFNDSFRLSIANSSSPTNQTTICNGAAFDPYDSSPLDVPGDEGYGNCQKKGIAWSSDRDVKFKSPSFGDNVWTARRSLYLGIGPNGTTDEETTADNNKTYYPTTDDANFAYGYYANETGHSVPVTTDEDLMVWMRTASLPSFRKLYRIINVDLEPGTYVMDIDEYYDVSSFDGEKFFALATVSWAGGRNDFLGIAYVVVGACALIAGLAFFVMHKLFGDRSQKAIEDLMEQMK